MKKKSNFLYFLNSIFIFFLTVYVLATCISYVLCFYSANKLPKYPVQEVLRVKIYGYTRGDVENTISASVSIMDSNGYDIATIERSWKGSYLAVEFSQIDILDKKFLFPARVYGKNKIIEDKDEIKNGTTLDKYYNENNQCMLLGSGSTFEERKHLFWLSNYAMKKYHLFDFGLVKTFSVDLSDCKPDRYYSISIDSNGNIFLAEL